MRSKAVLSLAILASGIYLPAAKACEIGCDDRTYLLDLPKDTKILLSQSAASAIRPHESCAEVLSQNAIGYCYICMPLKNSSSNSLVLKGAFQITSKFSPVSENDYLRNGDPSRKGLAQSNNVSLMKGYSAQVSASQDFLTEHKLPSDTKFYFQCNHHMANATCDKIDQSFKRYRAQIEIPHPTSVQQPKTSSPGRGTTELDVDHSDRIPASQ